MALLRDGLVIPGWKPPCKTKKLKAGRIWSRAESVWRDGCRSLVPEVDPLMLFFSSRNNSHPGTDWTRQMGPQLLAFLSFVLYKSGTAELSGYQQGVSSTYPHPPASPPFESLFSPHPPNFNVNTLTSASTNKVIIVIIINILYLL